MFGLSCVVARQHEGPPKIRIRCRHRMFNNIATGVLEGFVFTIYRLVSLPRPRVYLSVVCFRAAWQCIQISRYTIFSISWSLITAPQHVPGMIHVQNLLGRMIGDMGQDYATVGYSTEAAASVMDVLVLVSSEGQAVGSDIQVRNKI